MIDYTLNHIIKISSHFQMDEVIESFVPYIIMSFKEILVKYKLFWNAEDVIFQILILL